MYLLDVNDNVSTVLFFGTVGMLVMVIVIMLIYYFAVLRPKEQPRKKQDTDSKAVTGVRS